MISLLLYWITNRFPISPTPWLLSVIVGLCTCILAPMVLMLRKASSIIQYLLVFLPLYVLSLYSNVHNINNPLTVSAAPISTIKLLPLQFFITISIDAFLIGPVCLWLARLIVSIINPVTPPSPATMPEEWSYERVDKPKRDAGFWILRLLGIGYLAYLGLLLVGAFAPSLFKFPGIGDLFATTYRNPFLALCTMAKISLMIRMAFIGAYNKRLRFYTTLVLCIGHAVSVFCSFLFYVLGTSTGPDHDFLLLSGITDLVMVIAFIWILISSGKAINKQTFDKIRANTKAQRLLSIPATLLNWAFWGIGILALLMIGVAFYLRFHGYPNTPLRAIFHGPDPTLGNAVTMYTAIIVLCFLMVKNERLSYYLIGTLLRGYFIRIAGALIWLTVANVAIETETGQIIDIQSWFTFSLILVLFLFIMLLAFRKLFYEIEYTITSFRPSSAQNVLAIHQALFPEGPEDSGDILQAIDRYAGTIRGRKRGLLNFPFWLIENVLSVTWAFRPPFSTMSNDEQLYYLRHYLIRPASERQRSLIPAYADLTTQLSIAAHSMVMFAAYSNLKKHNRIGYIAPGARDRLQPEVPTGPPPFARIAPLPKHPNDPLNYQPLSKKPIPPKPAARLSTPVHEDPLPTEVDYIIIGSGPAGSVMAYRLIRANPTARILMIDRGNRYSPLQDFNDREIEMMAKVYKEGGLQQTKRADMSILQAECVGGGSVINNAVCYKLPARVKTVWKKEYGIPLDSLDHEYQQIARELGITRIGSNGVNTKVAHRFRKGVSAYNRTAPPNEQLQYPTLANINGANVAGDGLWNLGNKYLRKRSMLETYIPWAEARGVSVASNTTAVRFMSKQGRATSVVLQTASGRLHEVMVNKAVVVAAGTIASSHFLTQSEVKGSVGLGMSCNFALPVAFKFDEPIQAFDGEQITMGAISANDQMVFETYFNPPSTFGLSLPFYFGRYQALMDDYTYLLNFGVLVGSESNGKILSKADLLNGKGFSWELGCKDQDNIRYALTTLLKIGQGAGAKQVVVPLQPGLMFDVNGENVATFSRLIQGYDLMSAGKIMLNTAHPQGGNLMAGQTASAAIRAKRVVDETFRVEGFSNVFVADASVFPTSMNLNPQWTIMAMSSLASKHVLTV